MVSENTTRTSKSPAKTGFQSPLFLAIAICFSVMTVAAFIAVSISDFDLFAVLGFAFSLVSTIFAWIAFAKGHSKGSVKGLRLYMAYSNVINKIVLSFIYAIGGVLLVGCLILTLVGDIMTDTIIPALEQSVKPVLEQVIEYAGEFENMSLEEFDEFLAQSDLWNRA